MVQRQAVESIERQRIQIIAALHSNPNWDEEKADRGERIKELNEHFNKAIELVYFPDSQDEPEIDWSNPFYAAAKRGLERTREKYGLNSGTAETMHEVAQIDPKQQQARDKSKQEIDQL